MNDIRGGELAVREGKNRLKAKINVSINSLK